MWRLFAKGKKERKKNTPTTTKKFTNLETLKTEDHQMVFQALSLEA